MGCSKKGDAVAVIGHTAPAGQIGISPANAVAPSCTLQLRLSFGSANCSLFERFQPVIFLRRQHDDHFPPVLLDHAKGILGILGGHHLHRRFALACSGHNGYFS